MRLSHIARSNRAKEGDPGAYRPPVAAAGAAGGEGGSAAAAAAGDAGDVHLDSADAELNFAEEGPEEGVAADVSGGGGDGDGARGGVGDGGAGGDGDGGAEAGGDGGDGDGGDGGDVGDREAEEEDMGAPEDAANMRVRARLPTLHLLDFSRQSNTVTH